MTQVTNTPGDRQAEDPLVGIFIIDLLSRSKTNMFLKTIIRPHIMLIYPTIKCKIYYDIINKTLISQIVKLIETKCGRPTGNTYKIIKKIVKKRKHDLILVDLESLGTENKDVIKFAGLVVTRGDIDSGR